MILRSNGIVFWVELLSGPKKVKQTFFLVLKAAFEKIKRKSIGQVFANFETKFFFLTKNETGKTQGS
jgi:hypothetical protein